MTEEYNKDTAVGHIENQQYGYSIYNVTITSHRPQRRYKNPRMSHAKSPINESFSKTTGASAALDASSFLSKVSSIRLAAINKEAGKPMYISTMQPRQKLFGTAQTQKKEYRAVEKGRKESARVDRQAKTA